MDKTAFTRVMRAAVAEHFPEELVAFDIGGRHQIDILLAGNSGEPKQGVTSGEYKFDVASVEHILKFVVLCGSAYKAVSSLAEAARQHLPRPEREAKLAAEWRKRLIDAGIPGEKADAVAASFTRGLAAIVPEKDA